MYICMSLIQYLFEQLKQENFVSMIEQENKQFPIMFRASLCIIEIIPLVHMDMDISIHAQQKFPWDSQKFCSEYLQKAIQLPQCLVLICFLFFKSTYINSFPINNSVIFVNCLAPDKFYTLQLSIVFFRLHFLIVIPRKVVKIFMSRN